jgi:hypothetical protein
LTTRNNVKQREMTCGYAKGVDGINTVPAAATISRPDRSERHSGALTLTLDTAPSITSAHLLPGTGRARHGAVHG